MTHDGMNKSEMIHNSESLVDIEPLGSQAQLPQAFSSFLNARHDKFAKHFLSMLIR